MNLSYKFLALQIKMLSFFYLCTFHHTSHIMRTVVLSSNLDTNVPFNDITNYMYNEVYRNRILLNDMFRVQYGQAESKMASFD